MGELIPSTDAETHRIVHNKRKKKNLFVGSEDDKRDCNVLASAPAEVIFHTVGQDVESMIWISG